MHKTNETNETISQYPKSHTKRTLQEGLLFKIFKTCHIAYIEVTIHENKTTANIWKSG